MMLLVFLLPLLLPAQDTLENRVVPRIADSLRFDSVKTTTKKKAALTAKVLYSSVDSLRFEVKDQKVYLFKSADIRYEDINLKADYVEIDFPNNSVYAKGKPDSTGKEAGVPEFAEKDQKFKSKVLTYNYKTKQGYIQTVFTKQDEGYLHGQVVKKMENDITYIKDGSYTTCDLEEHPHFEFKFGKGKVIPGKKVITGPAYMRIAEVPTPLIIPFGYFPNKSGRRSGIIIPTYGESNNRGFFLQQGGYYWAISDYADVKLVGDIYSHGSWAIHPSARYKNRYHYGGSLILGYTHNRIGDPYANDFRITNDYEIRWSHSQDAKARPHSSFSANVNILSSSYNTNNLSSSTEAYLSNTYQSSINYATNWNDTYYLTLNFNHQQNTLNKTINVTLPQLQFSVNQFYPFRKKARVGKERWYEKISTKYTMDLENRYACTDSTFMVAGWPDSLQNGMRHQIPITGTFRVLKYFNWTNSLNLNDRMYLKSIRKRFINDTLVRGGDTVVGYYKTDTVFGFANAFDANFSTSLNTRIYGMYQFKKGPILAFRHMVTPSVSFTYTPDFGSPVFGYWREIENDTNAVKQKYSIFEKSIYGGPSQYNSGIVNFSISNNLEMKVRNRKDTVNGFKKIVLIEDLRIQASYDMAKDSVNWSKIGLSGYTTLFKMLRINYSGSFDPYARNSKGQRTNASEWKVNHRLLRKDQTTWTLGLNYSLSSDKVGKKKGKDDQPDKQRDAVANAVHGTPEERDDVLEYYDMYVDFNTAWSFTVNYNFSYNKDWNSNYTARTGKITQTLNFSGQLNLTPKWNVTLMTGWDFQASTLSYTRVDIYRDLHCWEMRFGWVPKGGQQQWDFSINVKASLLQDLKLNKKKDFRDYAD